MRTDTGLLGRSCERIRLNGPTMGTRYAAVLYAARVPVGLEDALLHSVTEVDEQMSTWKPDSELMGFNRAPVGDWVALPARLLCVVETGLSVGRITGGAFDIGVLDLVSAWGFNDHQGRPRLDEAEALARATRLPAYDLVELDCAGGKMRKTGPVTLDLSGIAKGYGVDRLAETMEAFGVYDHLVSIDGEVRARGRKLDGSPWRVALEAPVPGHRDVVGSVDLEDAALATSGNYRHRVVFEGKTYAHTIDPRTGRPLDNGIRSVTVRAPTCMLADAWATAVMVLGEPGLKLARRMGWRR